MKALKQIITKLSDKYKNAFSKEDAKSFNEHTKKLRNEWGVEEELNQIPNISIQYNTIKIPNEINKPHENMTVEEAKAYLKWFLSIKDERLKYLTERVFNTNVTVFSEHNLQALEFFFKRKYKSYSTK